MLIMQCHKAQNNCPNCQKRAETSDVKFFYSVLLKLLPFLTIAKHESSTRKTISWSVTVYGKKNCQPMQFDCSNKSRAE